MITDERAAALAVAVGAVRRIPLSQGYFATVDLIDYEPLSRLTWSATTIRGKVYAVRQGTRIDGSFGLIYMHRQIMGHPRDALVKHLDHDGLNNRRHNLRNSTQGDNQHSRKAHGATSSFKGVSRHTASGKWQAHIAAAGRRRYLGLFHSEVEAAHAYDAAAREMHGVCSRQNFAPA